MINSCESSDGHVSPNMGSSLYEQRVGASAELENGYMVHSMMHQGSVPKLRSGDAGGMRKDLDGDYMYSGRAMMVGECHLGNPSYKVSNTVNPPLAGTSDLGSMSPAGAAGFQRPVLKQVMMHQMPIVPSTRIYMPANAEDKADYMLKSCFGGEVSFGGSKSGAANKRGDCNNVENFNPNSQADAMIEDQSIVESQSMKPAKSGEVSQFHVRRMNVRAANMNSQRKNYHQGLTDHYYTHEKLHFCGTLSENKKKRTEEMRQRHNKISQKGRQKINEEIVRLRCLLPECRDSEASSSKSTMLTYNKAAILQSAVRYLEKLTEYTVAVWTHLVDVEKENRRFWQAMQQMSAKIAQITNCSLEEVLKVYDLSVRPKDNCSCSLVSSRHPSPPPVAFSDTGQQQHESGCAITGSASESSMPSSDKSCCYAMMSGASSRVSQTPSASGGGQVSGDQSSCQPVMSSNVLVSASSSNMGFSLDGGNASEMSEHSSDGSMSRSGSRGMATSCALPSSSADFINNAKYGMSCGGAMNSAVGNSGAPAAGSVSNLEDSSFLPDVPVFCLDGFATSVNEGGITSYSSYANQQQVPQKAMGGLQSTEAPSDDRSYSSILTKNANGICLSNLTPTDSSIGQPHASSSIQCRQPYGGGSRSFQSSQNYGVFGQQQIGGNEHMSSAESTSPLISNNISLDRNNLKPSNSIDRHNAPSNTCSSIAIQETANRLDMQSNLNSNQIDANYNNTSSNPVYVSTSTSAPSKNNADASDCNGHSSNLPQSSAFPQPAIFQPNLPSCGDAGGNLHRSVVTSQSQQLPNDGGNALYQKNANTSGKNGYESNNINSNSNSSADEFNSSTSTDELQSSIINQQIASPVSTHPLSPSLVFSLPTASSSLKKNLPNNLCNLIHDNTLGADMTGIVDSLVFESPSSSSRFCQYESECLAPNPFYAS